MHALVRPLVLSFTALLLCADCATLAAQCQHSGCGGGRADDGLACPGHACGVLERGTLMQWSGGSEGGPPGLDEPLATDRPDFTEASTTVGRGVAQLEFGYTYVYNDDNGDTTRSHSIGEPLLRVGVLADWLELRIATNVLQERQRTAAGEVFLDGMEDLYLGMKFGLTPQDGWLPEMALVPQMTVATGSGDLTNDETLPGLNWLYGWDVTERVSTAGSTQINRALDEATSEPYAELAQSWTVGFSLLENVGMYTEWFVLAPSGADTNRTEHYANGGFTWRVTNNLQFDVRAGYGLNAAADDYFTGAGGAVRF